MVSVAVGISDEADTGTAFADAADQAATGLAGAECDLCIVFAGAPHLAVGEVVLGRVHERLAPTRLIGCGAGGVLGSGREIENGSGAVVWALSAPAAEIASHELVTEPVEGGMALGGLPEDPADYGETLIVLADPNSFSAEALLLHVNEARPGLPVLGGLASATAPGSASLFHGDEIVEAGAVACSLSGVSIVPCVSQGATPVGPEMTITEADGNVITQLASQPALERLRDAIEGLEDEERELAAHGLLVGIVIDENRPEYERGDFLVRPIVGADPDSGTIAVAERVRVGQTVRLQVRDGVSADRDLQETLGLQADAIGSSGAAGALLFTCNGRGSHMFDVADHDARAIDDALEVPSGGFFCAGEIGPVGGRNFVHSFTATIAVFPRD